MNKKVNPAVILNAIQDNLPFGIVLLNSEREIEYMNSSAARLLGLDDRGEMGKKLEEALAAHGEIQATVHTCLEQADGCEREVILPDKNSQYLLRVSKINDTASGFSGYLLQFRDISQQRNLEHAMSETKEGVASLVDRLNDYYFETDITGVVTNINMAFCRQLGYANKEDIIGKHLRHFTDRSSVRLVYQNFDKVFQTKETVEVFRYTYHTKDGRAYIGETTISPIMEGERVVGARGVMRDMTERIKAEESLRKANEDFEARARELAMLNRISTLSGESLNLNHLLQALCEELPNIFPVRNAGIGLITPDKESIEVVAFHSRQSGEESILGMLLPYKDNQAFQEVIRNKKAVGIQDSQTDPRMHALAGLAAARGTKSILIVPLLSRGSAIGVIWMPAMDPEYAFQEKEIALAQIIASQVATAVDNAQLFAKTETALDRAEHDLEIGKAIQSGFFPEELPEVPGWEIATHFESARYVSGDFYDIFPLEGSNQIAFVIADVCDKGVGAALFMVLFRSLFRAFSKIAHTDKPETNLQKIIQNTNDYVTRIHGNANMFATVFFGVLDPDSGTLYYVNGGHEPPVVLNEDGKIQERLEPTGPAIGLFGEARYQVKQFTMEPGDFLVGYTDGVTDAENDKGVGYTEDRFLKYIQSPWSSLFSMVFELKGELQRHKGEQWQFDDITLLALRRKPKPFQVRHGICRRADSSSLADMLDFCEAVAAENHLLEEEKTALWNALEKSYHTIIQHSYEGRAPGYLSLFFEREADEIAVIVRDDGETLTEETLEELSRQVREDGKGEAVNGTTRVHFSYGQMQERGNQLTLSLTRQHRKREKVRS